MRTPKPTVARLHWLATLVAGTYVRVHQHNGEHHTARVFEPSGTWKRRGCPIVLTGPWGPRFESKGNRAGLSVDGHWLEEATGADIAEAKYVERVTALARRLYQAVHEGRPHDRGAPRLDEEAFAILHAELDRAKVRR